MNVGKQLSDSALMGGARAVTLWTVSMASAVGGGSAFL